MSHGRISAIDRLIAKKRFLNSVEVDVTKLATNGNEKSADHKAKQDSKTDHEAKEETKMSSDSETKPKSILRKLINNNNKQEESNTTDLVQPPSAKVRKIDAQQQNQPPQATPTATKKSTNGLGSEVEDKSFKITKGKADKESDNEEDEDTSIANRIKSMRRRSSKSVGALLKVGAAGKGELDSESAEAKLNLKSEPVSHDEETPSSNINETIENESKSETTSKSSSLSDNENSSKKEKSRVVANKAPRKTPLAEKKASNSNEGKKESADVVVADEGEKISRARKSELTAKKGEKENERDEADSVDVENSQDGDVKSSKSEAVVQKRGPGRPKKSQQQQLQQQKLVEEKTSEILDSESLDKRSLNLKGRLVRHKQSQAAETESDSDNADENDDIEEAEEEEETNDENNDVEKNAKSTESNKRRVVGEKTQPRRSMLAEKRKVNSVEAEEAKRTNISLNSVETKRANFLNPKLAALNFSNLFYCNFCGFSASSTEKILNHLFIHVFKCQNCSFFTYTKYDLMKHIYKSHYPSKDLKVKRLVLEVNSNDWYFLCSENETHRIKSGELADLGEQSAKLVKSASKTSIKVVPNVEQTMRQRGREKANRQAAAEIISHIEKSPLVSKPAATNQTKSSLLLNKSHSLEKKDSFQKSKKEEEEMSLIAEKNDSPKNVDTVILVEEKPSRVENSEKQASSQEKSSIESVVEEAGKSDDRSSGFKCKQCSDFEARNADEANEHCLQKKYEHTFKCSACEKFTSKSVEEIIEHRKQSHNETIENADLVKQLFDNLNESKTETLIELDATKAALETTEIPTSDVQNGKSLEGLSSGDNKSDETMKESESGCRHEPKTPSYDSEILDNGSQIFICSACKLVFLNLDSLKEHTCKQELLLSSAGMAQQIAARKLSDSTRSANDAKNVVKLEIKHENLRDAEFLNDEIIMDDDDDDENGKMNGDIIYME